MPQVRLLAEPEELTDIVVTDENDEVVDLNMFARRKIKRAIKCGTKVIVHLADSPDGALLVFNDASEYERSIVRLFVPQLPSREEVQDGRDDERSVNRIVRGKVV